MIYPIPILITKGSISADDCFRIIKSALIIANLLAVLMLAVCAWLSILY